MEDKTTKEKTTKSKTTTAKSTSSKAAANKKTTQNKPNELDKKTAEIPAEHDITAIKVEEKPVRKFANDDMIPCKSIRYGTMQHISKKSGSIYEWSDYGDVCDIAYADLMSLKAAKSKFIYEPWFIILDEDLVDQWNLKELYNIFYEFDDIESFLLQGASKVRSVLQDAPRGYKDVIVDTAGNMLRSGRLDSIATVKVIDDMLNTQLSMLLGGR